MRWFWFSVLSVALGLALRGQSTAVVTPAKGTQIVVRTVDPIQSKDGEVGQSYRATLDKPIVLEGKEIAAKGADCVLRILETKEAGKVTGKRELKLVLSEVRINGNLVTVNTDAAAIEGKGKGGKTAMRGGIGAGVGAGLGAVLGGGKGAAIGAGIGGAAGAASSILTSGPEVKVKSETVLTFTVR